MKIEKTYFVAPPYKNMMEGFPGALTALKNYTDIKFSDNSIKILDLTSKSETEIDAEIQGLSNNQQVLVGITVTGATYQSAIQLSRKIKNHNPLSTIILGGQHLHKKTGQAQIVIEKYPWIDYVCIGDGEKSIEALMKGKKFEDVPNVAYKKEEVKYSMNGELTTLELSSIPFKTYETDSKKGKFDEGISYVSGKGCDHACTHCTSPGRIREKSEESIIQDLEYLVSQGQIKVAFENNFFSVDTNKTYQLAKKIIKKKEENQGFKNFSWTCQTRIGSLSTQEIDIDKYFHTLRESGCSKIYIGLESFDPRILKELNKLNNKELSRFLGHEGYLNQAFLEINKGIEKGIDYGIMLMVKRPSETEETNKLLIEGLRKLDQINKDKSGAITAYLSLSTLYPGTKDTRDLIKELGLKSWKTIFDDYTLFEEKLIEDKRIASFLSENFAHSIGGIPWGIMDYETLRNQDFKIDSKKLHKLEELVHNLRGQRFERLKIFNFCI